MNRAILCCWHKYTPFGDRFYEPILDFQIQTLNKYKDEFDHLYLIDSNWEILPEQYTKIACNFTIVRVNPSLRYYDAYKAVLPQIKEDLVLLVDNDFLVYKRGIIKRAFDLLEEEENEKNQIDKE